MKSACRVLLTLLAAMVAVEGQVPIPRRKVGFVYGSGQANAPVYLDFYIDLICPDSKAALPTILQLADYYGPDKLLLTTHLFPLPYHRNGFYAAKGAHVVEAATKSKSTYDWFKILYDNIESLTNTATHQISDEAVVQRLEKLASDTGVPASLFSQMIDNETVEMDTRVGWKYCCTRGVAATPTFMVNDVFVGADPTWTLADWRKVIDPLVKSQASDTLHFQSEMENDGVRTCPSSTKTCTYLPGKVECCTAGEYCVPNVGCRC